MMDTSESGESYINHKFGATDEMLLDLWSGMAMMTFLKTDLKQDGKGLFEGKRGPEEIAKLSFDMAECMLKEKKSRKK